MKNIIIYTGPSCNYCDAAKRLLTRNNAPFKEIDIATVENSGRWVFDIHPQYTIALASITKQSQSSSNHIYLRGPFGSLKSFNQEKNKYFLI